MNATRQTIARYLAATATYYGRELDSDSLSMMVDDLEDLGADRVVQALTKYRRDAKNRAFPLPAQLRVIVEPEVDADAAAREIAARIEGAIVKHGWNNALVAREMIGEIGWRVVERNGGWMHLCQNHGVTIDPSAFQAQARELAKAEIKYSPSQMQKAIQSGMGREISGFIGGLVKDLNHV